MGNLSWILFYLTNLYLPTLILANSQQLKIGNAKFAQEFYNVLKKFNSIDSNFVYSPFSLSACAGLLAIGANGKTLTQLQNVMHYPTAESEFLDEFNNVLTSLQNSTSTSAAATVRIANGIFPDQEFELDTEYIGKSRSYFKAEVQNVDYRNPTSSAELINKYVDKATQHTIKEIISKDDIDPSTTKLVLVNALYFKSAWEKAFDLSATKRKPFHLSSTNHVDVQMMSRVGQVPYAEINELDAQVLSLPYKDPRFNMLIILTRTKDGITALEGKLGTINLGQLYKKLNLQKVRIFLPKFKVESEINLHKPLKEAGVPSIFEDADFSRITKQLSLKVYQIVQKVYIQVDEKGTEAAAVTRASLGNRAAAGGPPAIEFLADHPFIVILQYLSSEVNSVRAGRKINHGHIAEKHGVQAPDADETSTILFMGRVQNPSKN